MQEELVLPREETRLATILSPLESSRQKDVEPKRDMGRDKARQ